MASYTCPDCGRVSHHPRDQAERFCVVCGFESTRADSRTLARATAYAAAERARVNLETALSVQDLLSDTEQVRLALATGNVLALIAALRPVD